MYTLKPNSQSYFYKLLLILLILVGTGLVLSFSISYSFSLVQGRDVGSTSLSSNFILFKLFIKQLIATLIGLLGIFYLLKTPTKKLKIHTNVLALLAGLAMIYTVLVAPEINGSKRWINIAGISIQTGDFARLALILYIASIFSQYHTALYTEVQYTSNFDKSRINTRLLFRFLPAVLIYLGTLYFQKDYSSFLISASVIMVIVLVSDIPNSWKMLSVVIAISTFVILIVNSPTRMLRILDYIKPGIDPSGTEFQLQKSYEVIGNGGWLGSGVGTNMLNVVRLPYFNNDFVFSVIIGEYGLIGGLGVIIMFWLIYWYAFKLSRKMYNLDRYYYFLLIAGVVNLLVSVVAHISVTLGIVPTAGLNLPFYSSGGSSMVTSLLSYGLILKSALALDRYETVRIN